jgi:hypothetical protein
VISKKNNFCPKISVYPLENGVGNQLMMKVSQLGGAAKMMMDQRLLKCRLTAISFTTKII